MSVAAMLSTPPLVSAQSSPCSVIVRIRQRCRIVVRRGGGRFDAVVDIRCRQQAISVTLVIGRWWHYPLGDAPDKTARGDEHEIPSVHQRRARRKERKNPRSGSGPANNARGNTGQKILHGIKAWQNSLTNRSKKLLNLLVAPPVGT